VARSDGMHIVRTELSGRLDRLEKALGARGPIGAQNDAAMIALMAGEYGLSAVRRLAEGLTVALDAGGRGAAIGPWIEKLRDAIDCESADEKSGDTWLASIMVRLAG
jgi:hypothetical protein